MRVYTHRTGWFVGFCLQNEGGRMQAVFDCMWIVQMALAFVSATFDIYVEKNV